MRTLRGVPICCLALAVVVAGCGPAERSPGPDEQRSAAPLAATAKKRLVVAIQSDPASLSNLETNPPTTIGSLAGTEELQELVHVGLANRDDHGAARALLAEAVPTTENGLWRVFPDGRMETTWRIREGAVWHDGAPFTTEDLTFTARVKRDREVPIFHSSSLDLIESVDAPDPRTVTVRWRSLLIEADLLFSKALAIPLPKHLLEDSYAEDRVGFIQLPYWNDAFVGTGPYRIRQWVRSSHVTLDANERYVLGTPRIHEIEVKFIPGPEPIMTQTLAGAIEFPLGRGIDFEQALAIRDQRQNAVVTFTARSLGAIYPQFVDPSPPVVAQLAFRRAVLHAIDREELTDSMHRGLSRVAHSIVHPDVGEYREVERSIIQYEYDPRRATQLLEELGYAMGPDGTFRDGAGQRLALEIRSTAQVQGGTAIFPVAHYLQRVGVALETTVVPVQRVTDREYRATFPALEYTSGRTDLGSPRLKLFHSSSAGLRENRFQASGNYARYMNPELDELIERYVTTIPRSERLRALGQIVHHQTSQLTLLGLFYPLGATFSTTRMENVTRGPENTVASNVHLWDIRESER